MTDFILSMILMALGVVIWELSTISETLKKKP